MVKGGEALTVCGDKGRLICCSAACCFHTRHPLAPTIAGKMRGRSLCSRLPRTLVTAGPSSILGWRQQEPGGRHGAGQGEERGNEGTEPADNQKTVGAISPTSPLDGCDACWPDDRPVLRDLAGPAYVERAVCDPLLGPLASD